MKTGYKILSINVLAALFLVLLNGCTVKYVAEYDAGIKEEIVEIAKKVDIFWGELLDRDGDDRKYSSFKSAYNEIEADIRGLVMKNEIRPLNKASTKQVRIALDLWVEDRELHKKKDGFSDFQAKRHRKQFNRVFTAMAIGEDLKKQ
ncbi:MAG: hypothetical protein OEV42_02560 [Deltaproteobacteria bacterium]|nr:hypothetical protein [Deltaproteobacteria bacterium]